MTFIDLGVLLAVGALWGASFLFMREAAPVLGPVGMTEARVLLAGLCLLAVTAALRRISDLRRDPGGFLVLGALTAAVPFTLIAVAELRITASLAAILNATTPLFALLVSSIRQRARPSGGQFTGVLLGVVGVAVLVGLGPPHVDGTLLLAVGASLLAALCYALGGTYTQIRFPGTHPLVTATGQQLGAAVILLGPALALPPRRSPGTGILLAVLALALACTALGFVLFFRMVSRVGPTGALSVTFLVPLFGLLWGTVFLGEPLSWSTPFGMALVLAAVFLVTDRRPPAPARPQDGHVQEHRAAPSRRHRA
ncbi:DMT family transporter [Thermomonospora cellulosilytica]|uniref:Drug/metabolite transporter (DMT)-like permease n=1 Tax=Thermomonospora cellulosilytica TaxID=1411118 RepID=A0A7W3N465_9ACTN|nr:DMT family transporter [Thermomonospora cellulosilytica]MBA9007221.1 drug/metabolite transporter (DMT)-like permease [Thermomonospora cellulosilytica]